ncbi:MAG: AAA family ATPase [candidate division WS1 bacterium]|jgi:wobble nucleotide-excising tRNase|nr:AAA family ATPase [candidate division WS1 bacterium]
MIEKLIRLENIGVFENALPNGRPIELARCIVIYGGNGRGKTTLSHLFRSLCTGDCNCLRPRATIGGSGTPSAKLRISGSCYLLNNYTWRPSRVDIEIYDADFVSRNVHSGSGVTAEHRSNLCRFVLGEKAVKLAEKVDSLNDEVKEAHKAITSVETALQSVVGKHMEIDQFLGLSDDPDIEANIIEAQKLVDAAADAADILEHPKLASIEIPRVPTATDVASLVETIEALSADVVAMVRQHMSEHLGDDSEAWLRTGVEYLEDDICPFCGQDTKGLRLLDAFRVYFGKAYEALVSRVETEAQALAKLYSELKLSNIRTALAENTTMREYWSKYATVEEAIPRTLGELDALWRQVTEKLLPLFAEKLGNPSEPVSFENPLSELGKLHAAAMTAVTSYNQRVDRINKAVAECKDKLSTGDADTHAVALRQLQLQKRRWEKGVAAQCKTVQQTRKLKKEREDAKETAKKNLEKHLREFAESYTETLNEFLTKCGVAFRIESIKPTFGGGDARSDYEIELFGKTFSASAKPSHEPHFDTALSEGDKRTLAFAFFLARMQRDADIKDKTVVLDDPVASLDHHRRWCTIETIVELSKKCGQLIVMTHDPHFACDTSETLTQAGMAKGGNLLTLALQRSGP